jgi:hypothetical protein
VTSAKPEWSGTTYIVAQPRDGGRLVVRRYAGDQRLKAHADMAAAAATGKYEWVSAATQYERQEGAACPSTE